jgi:hypothetical protein
LLTFHVYDLEILLDLLLHLDTYLLNLLPSFPF